MAKLPKWLKMAKMTKWSKMAKMIQNGQKCQK